MSGEFSPNPNDPREIRTRQLIQDAFFYHLYRWNLEERQESPSELAERVLPFMMNGTGLLN